MFALIKKRRCLSPSFASMTIRIKQQVFSFPVSSESIGFCGCWDTHELSARQRFNKAWRGGRITRLFYSQVKKNSFGNENPNFLS